MGKRVKAVSRMVAAFAGLPKPDSTRPIRCGGVCGCGGGGVMLMVVQVHMGSKGRKEKEKLDCVRDVYTGGMSKKRRRK